MKKIVGILGMAAVLGSMAFAAEPAANFVMAEFTGNAEFGWKADFAKKDAEMGMFNGTSANLKFGFVDAGDKTTTGDGVWGELKIKADGSSVSNGAIKLGDKDYVTGDVNLTKQEKQESGLITRADKDKDAFMNLPGLFPVAKVDTAKIHFDKGDFNLALNILAPGLKYDKYTPFVATPVGLTTIDIDAQAKKGDVALYTNGFGLEFGMKDLFAANFKLMDNGLGKADKKEMALAFDAALKAIENLDLTVAGAFNFIDEKDATDKYIYTNNKYVGFQTTAAYKFAINDKLYVKPGVSYAYSDNDDAKDNNVNSFAGGVMFGWGASGLKPELDFIANDSDKFNEGVSVAVAYTTRVNTLLPANIPGIIYPADGFKLNCDVLSIGASLYDQSLFNLLGLEDFGTLKTGVEYKIDMATSSDKMPDDKKHKFTSATLAAALKYNVKLGIVDVALHGGMQLSNMITCDVDGYKAPDMINKFNYGVTIGTKEIIDNTNVYVSYDGQYDSSYKEVQAKADGYNTNIKKSLLTVGTKISF